MASRLPPQDRQVRVWLVAGQFVRRPGARAVVMYIHVDRGLAVLQGVPCDRRSSGPRLSPRSMARASSRHATHGQHRRFPIELKYLKSDGKLHLAIDTVRIWRLVWIEIPKFNLVRCGPDPFARIRPTRLRVLGVGVASPDAHGCQRAMARLSPSATIGVWRQANYPTSCCCPAWPPHLLRINPQRRQTSSPHLRPDQLGTRSSSLAANT
ncbi:hypothetical protein H310_14348 [Aphanomyces invadans]|uniref:Uncharacterized protein n=1 Tax=Aphanomyces invadans TaxID=157072 RepID=A0A024TA85_9STRA|nr:hypothetical protein H310_14348 [Aphanomyces invadans]ETV90933.1 hypothetical protein H310_14348 [Aphanomyces invadans]|eukprot:XP_008880415.1 hypothetical protein H310_14348 [Aphanomyces invadans]